MITPKQLCANIANKVYIDKREVARQLAKKLKIISILQAHARGEILSWQADEIIKLHYESNYWIVRKLKMMFS